jgi:hypothetical protein
MTAPIAKACRMSAMRVGHSPAASGKVPMAFSPVLYWRIVHRSGFLYVMEVTNRRNVITITV